MAPDQDHLTPPHVAESSVPAIRLGGPRQLVPASEPAPDGVLAGEVVIRLELVGLCGSDRAGYLSGHDLEGLAPQGFPAHECVGTVVHAAESELLGRRVLAIPVADRGLRRYITAAAEKVHVLAEPALPAGQAVVIQPLATVLGALDRIPALDGADVAVLGLGPAGLLFGHAARRRGAATVTGIDLRDRSTAPLTGHLDAIARPEDLPDARFDVVIEAVGHQQETVNTAIRLAGRRGTVLAFGVPDDEHYRLDYGALFRKSLALVANVQPDWRHYLPAAERELRADLGPYTSVVTHHFDVADVQQAFDTAFDRTVHGGGKVLISFGSWT